MRNFYDILFHNDGNVVFISKRNRFFTLGNQRIACFDDNSRRSGINHRLQGLGAKARNIEALILRRLRRLRYNNAALAQIAAAQNAGVSAFRFLCYNIY